MTVRGWSGGEGFTAAIFWTVGYENSDDGLLLNEFPDDYSWDVDSGKLTYIGLRKQEPNSIRENPCWCLVPPSIRAAMSAIADNIFE